MTGNMCAREYGFIQAILIKTYYQQSVSGHHSDQLLEGQLRVPRHSLEDQHHVPVPKESSCLDVYEPHDILHLDVTLLLQIQGLQLQPLLLQTPPLEPVGYSLVPVPLGLNVLLHHAFNSLPRIVLVERVVLILGMSEQLFHLVLGYRFPLH